ncbi:hypothetical protein N7492_008510 [Penicillium capsulatum]|uniref:Uncharacterized protein n=1 Tax=Penicillium capsulatum TaxID=69766 RepID=A0A9W9HS35_9EURO|nr:hypothetical protein N7492_008510 [Penicillium capsulatum]KAJ6105911.1 hypothetical protein N7512_009428 [Penicillium capsulatum]
MFVVMAVLVGMSWATISEDGKRILTGIAGIFPTLLECLRLTILLRNSNKLPYGHVYCLAVALFSSISKVTSSFIGSICYTPVYSLINFVLCLDYLGMASFCLWLSKQGVQGSSLRPQLQSTSCRMYFITGCLSVIAIVGTALNVWLLSLELELLIATFWTCRHLLPQDSQYHDETITPPRSLPIHTLDQQPRSRTYYHQALLDIHTQA